jgi:hypothetical protein
VRFGRVGLEPRSRSGWINSTNPLPWVCDTSVMIQRSRWMDGDPERGFDHDPRSHASWTRVFQQCASLNIASSPHRPRPQAIRFRITLISIVCDGWRRVSRVAAWDRRGHLSDEDIKRTGTRTGTVIVCGQRYRLIGFPAKEGGEEEA